MKCVFLVIYLYILETHNKMGFIRPGPLDFLLFSDWIIIASFCFQMKRRPIYIKACTETYFLKENLNSKKTKQVFLFFFLLLLYCYYHTTSHGHDIHFKHEKNVIKTSRSLMCVCCVVRIKKSNWKHSNIESTNKHVISYCVVKNFFCLLCNFDTII